MPTPEIEEFAKLLVRHVRDAAIQACDAELRPTARSPVATRWRKSQVPAEAVAEVIPDCVDEAIFRLLHAIDDGLLQVRFVSKSGNVVDLRGEGLGELAGWYVGSGGWRALFSEERFVDDFADMDQE